MNHKTNPCNLWCAYRKYVPEADGVGEPLRSSTPTDDDELGALRRRVCPLFDADVPDC
jgi:hypothetical protein